MCELSFSQIFCWNNNAQNLSAAAAAPVRLVNHSFRITVLGLK